MGMGGMKRGGALAEINVTPLVDVMLVLLIIFMVTAPLIQQGVEVDLPEAKAADMPGDDKKLVLTIDRDKRFHLGKNLIADCSQLPLEECMVEVENKLKFNEKVAADKELYLKGDKILPYGLVVATMAAIKAAGVDKLGMVTEPLE